MSDKHFAAILAKNDLAEKIGELVATNQIGVSDKTYILACLNDIEKYIGVGNQPNIEDSFNEGCTKVEANPAYYGL